MVPRYYELPQYAQNLIKKTLENNLFNMYIVIA